MVDGESPKVACLFHEYRVESDIIGYRIGYVFHE